MIKLNFIALSALELPSTEPLPTVADKLEVGITVTLLGMATIFVVLAILWGILSLFKVFFYRQGKPEKKAESAPATAPAPTPAPAPAPVEVQPAAPAEDNGAVVAAITAAITAYTAEDPVFQNGFRVVSFRRYESASPWTKR